MQKEVINLAKKNFSWRELSKEIGVCEGYLRNELRNEKRLISEKTYENLCRVAEKNLDRYIEKKLEDNWGKSKGGFASEKKLKKIIIPERNNDLAEAIGIILGDGHLSEFVVGKKIRNYSIRIAGNMDTDIDYMTNYIPSLFKKLFKEKGKLHSSKKSFTGYFTLYGKEYILLMKSLGINSGNKKKNNQGIPNWIKKDKNLLKKCIKGLIDTDGSVHIISKNNHNLRIDYTSYISRLINDVRMSFIRLGFSPSKIINNKHFFLSKQEDIKKYINEIGFGNQKNLNRLESLRKNAPVV